MDHLVRDQIQGMTAQQAVRFLLDFIESNFSAQDKGEISRLMQTYGFTPLEAQVFATLARRAGIVMSKDRIHAAIYTNPDTAADIKIVDVLVCKVRKKLKAKGYPHEIKTQWGGGYFHEKVSN